MIDKRISDNLVRLVGIIYGVVVVQSLVRYDYIVTDPLNYDYRIGLAALLAVYVTVVLSWVDWHTVMELRPYRLSPRNKWRRRSEIFRLWADLGVVTVYAYLLFSIEPFAKSPDANIQSHLLGYPFIFLTYLLSGLSRKLTHGRYASNITPIAVFGASYAGLFFLYEEIDWSQVAWVRGELARINLTTLGAALFLMLAYRFARTKVRDTRDARKREGLVIGFDVDGVLANQIDGLLPKLNERLGTNLAYDDIVEWDLRIDDTDISTEILAAMDDDEYLLEMPLHAGAKKAVESLYSSNTIYVLTARPKGTYDTTISWLENNAIPFNRLFNVQEEKKSLYRTDVLIDDYIKNVKEYLENTNGTCLLIHQPWNRNRKEVQSFIDSGRLQVGTLADITGVVEQERARRA